jgi:hypothetical protein
MPTRIAAFFSLLLVALALTAVACSGSSSEVKFPETIVIKDGEIVPILANSELVVGPNRMALGILDPEGVPLVDAKVHLTFYELNSGEPAKKFEMPAVSRVPSRDAGLTEQVEHIHTDGTKHVHFNVGEEVGVYTAMVTFDQAGLWGVKIDVESDKPKLKKTLLPRFNVLERGLTPAVGSPAPRSRNLTVADVSDLSQIDSSAKPSPEMHTTTVADAIDAGRPVLVLFAVPGFCESRLCGPELEIMRKLYPTYKDRVEFIHVEFYKDPGTPQRVVVDAAREWNLRSEPWFFFIDSKGNVAAKFEGPSSLQELEEALKKLQ